MCVMLDSTPRFLGTQHRLEGYHVQLETLVESEPDNPCIKVLKSCVSRYTSTTNIQVHLAHVRKLSCDNVDNEDSIPNRLRSNVTDRVDFRMQCLFMEDMRATGLFISSQQKPCSLISALLAVTTMKKLQQDGDSHPDGALMNIVTGQIAHPDVNAEDAVSLGQRAMTNFKAGWPGSFYDPLGKLVVAMDVTKKHVLVGKERVYDQELIYSRVVGLHAISREINFDDVLAYELAAYPP
ncbi:hypothetical protein LSH36_10g12018 [Paralvinella palmiformis]|uniref:Uncharacterized protein n=1 Tax=Paralvinella palmiformis TaxID=53620 RepID=A0AAD9KDZ9_9ANNE|nr:hypothetical protein LSH36_10g12018 [Paralvinella palmiformis]